MSAHLHDDLVHDWFGLTYASYLVLPRIVLQSMPAEWQRRFLDCIDEIQETLRVDDMPSYMVQARDDSNGRFTHDPYRKYRHAPSVPRREASHDH